MIRIIREALYNDYLRTKYANHEQRGEDLGALEVYARSYQSPIDFLSQLSLMSTADADGTRTAVNKMQGVTLSTIHQAKGLEWGAVFLIWLTEGLFPSSRSLNTPDALEEERRLFYVAATRAQDQLYLSYPRKRTNVPRDREAQTASRFLLEIPRELTKEWRF